MKLGYRKPTLITPAQSVSAGDVLQYYDPSLLYSSWMYNWGVNGHCSGSIDSEGNILVFQQRYRFMKLSSELILQNTTSGDQYLFTGTTANFRGGSPIHQRSDGKYTSLIYDTGVQYQLRTSVTDNTLSAGSRVETDVTGIKGMYTHSILDSVTDDMVILFFTGGYGTLCSPPLVDTKLYICKWSTSTNTITASPVNLNALTGQVIGPTSPAAYIIEGSNGYYYCYSGTFLLKVANDLSSATYINLTTLSGYYDSTTTTYSSIAEDGDGNILLTGSEYDDADRNTFVARFSPDLVFDKVILLPSDGGNPAKYGLFTAPDPNDGSYKVLWGESTPSAVWKIAVVDPTLTTTERVYSIPNNAFDYRTSLYPTGGLFYNADGSKLYAVASGTVGNMEKVLEYHPAMPVGIGWWKRWTTITNKGNSVVVAEDAVAGDEVEATSPGEIVDVLSESGWNYGDMIYSTESGKPSSDTSLRYRYPPVGYAVGPGRYIVADSTLSENVARTNLTGVDCVIVDKYGSGDYLKVSEACAASPNGATIYIKPGRYWETGTINVKPGQKLIATIYGSVRIMNSLGSNSTSSTKHETGTIDIANSYATVSGGTIGDYDNATYPYQWLWVRGAGTFKVTHTLSGVMYIDPAYTTRIATMTGVPEGDWIYYRGLTTVHIEGIHFGDPELGVTVTGIGLNHSAESYVDIPSVYGCSFNDCFGATIKIQEWIRNDNWGCNFTACNVSVGLLHQWSTSTLEFWGVESSISFDRVLQKTYSGGVFTLGGRYSNFHIKTLGNTGVRIGWAKYCDFVIDTLVGKYSNITFGDGYVGTTSYLYGNHLRMGSVAHGTDFTDTIRVVKTYTGTVMHNNTIEAAYVNRFYMYGTYVSEIGPLLIRFGTCRYAALPGGSSPGTIWMEGFVGQLTNGTFLGSTNKTYALGSVAWVEPAEL